MKDPQVHRVLVTVLHALRYTESARFSQLMQETALQSDDFKFYLRDLVRKGFVHKLDDGSYALTAKGKEFANNLDESIRTLQKQPKVSVLIVVRKESSDGDTRYLLQKRTRQPFYGYWSEIHGRAVWSETFEETARRQLKRQTGLDADFHVHSFRRIRDFAEGTDDILEDKLFVIMSAENLSGEMTNTYDGGLNAWLTIDELQKEEKVFASTLDTIETLSNPSLFSSQDLTYDIEAY